MKIQASSKFDRELKHLYKKYRSLKNDLAKLGASLEINPKQGDYLGHDCYKIHLAIASKGRGKSGGGRVITCVKIVEDTVY